MKKWIYLLVILLIFPLFSCEDTPPPPTQAPTPNPTPTPEIPACYAVTGSASENDCDDANYCRNPDDMENGKPVFHATSGLYSFKIYWNAERDRWEIFCFDASAPEYEYYHPDDQDFLPPESGWFAQHDDALDEVMRVTAY